MYYKEANIALQKSISSHVMTDGTFIKNMLYFS